MNGVILISNIVEENGKTVRENNLEKKHAIALGSLVEINIDYIPEHKLRLFVQEHSRDCDGTPLYSLSSDIKDIGIDPSKTEFDDPLERFLHIMARGRIKHGFSDKSLIVIEEGEKVLARIGDNE